MQGEPCVMQAVVKAICRDHHINQGVSCVYRSLRLYANLAVYNSCYQPQLQDLKGHVNRKQPYVYMQDFPLSQQDTLIRQYRGQSFCISQPQTRPSFLSNVNPNISTAAERIIDAIRRRLQQAMSSTPRSISSNIQGTLDAT